MGGIALRELRALMSDRVDIGRLDQTAGNAAAGTPNADVVEP